MKDGLFTLAMVIICSSESLSSIFILASMLNKKGNWQNENLYIGLDGVSLIMS